MFRSSKNILIILIVAVSLVIFSNIIKEYDDETIPESTIAIQINSAQHKNTKK